MATFRLLLIDDDSAILRSVGEYFKRLGYEVHQAADGKSGIQTFDRVHPEVVILDLHLPDMSGLKVLEEIRKRNGPVVMLTGEGDVDTAVEAMRLGAENFLSKPVEMQHLVATVEKAAEKGILKRENEDMRLQLAPDLGRRLRRFAFFVVLVLASIFVGRWIGGGEQDRAAAPIPIPLRQDTSHVDPRDTVYRPPLPPGGAIGPGLPAGGAPGGTPPIRH